MESVHDGVAQISGENTWLGRSIVGVFAWFRADINDLALLYDHHTLSVCDCDSGSGGDNVVASLGIGGTFGCALLPLYCQNVIVDGITVEKFFPLICKCTACGAKCCFNKSPYCNSFLFDRSMTGKIM